MKRAAEYAACRTTKAYDELLKLSYAGVKRRVEEIEMPAVQAIAVNGHEPPAGAQYQRAIAVLYGIGYGLKMGLKYGKLAKPAGYFDYKVGALGTYWWAVGGKLDIHDSETLRWQAYLMVPPFVSAMLVAAARSLVAEKHPDLPYEEGHLVTLAGGHAVQILHVGPYDREEPSLDQLHAYLAEHSLAVAGRHHEIYLSDPRRTVPEKLKTVIRLGVAPRAAGQPA